MGEYENPVIYLLALLFGGGLVKISDAFVNRKKANSDIFDAKFDNHLKAKEAEQRELACLRDRVDTLQKAVNELLGDKTTLHQETINHREENLTLRDENRKLTAENDDLRKVIEELREDNKKIRAELEELKAQINGDLDVGIETTD